MKLYVEDVLLTDYLPVGLTKPEREVVYLDKNYVPKFEQITNLNKESCALLCNGHIKHYSDGTWSIQFIDVFGTNNEVHEGEYLVRTDKGYIRWMYSINMFTRHFKDDFII